MGTTIETITVTRPMKVIAFTCCFITTFVMIATCATTDWSMTEGWREGLWQQCTNEGAPTPIPFGIRPIPGCYKAHNAGYIKITAALVIVTAVMDLFGTILTGLGLRSTDPNKKYKYYRVAIYALVICVGCLFAALVLYPVSYQKELAGGYEGEVYDGGRVQPFKGSLDFDKDGIPDYEDLDDDNDGIPDTIDPDDDNDGIPDHIDPDDDDDGVPDEFDTFGMTLNGRKDVDDQDGDGIDDSIDTDDDNDGIPDHLDNDDDNDGINDTIDDDDDNDGIPDHIDNDIDGDGIPDAIDDDDDNDGIVDALDNDDDGDGISDAAEDGDTDDDGIPDHLDDDDDGDGIVDSLDELDTDGDGVPDSVDKDDDNDGIADVDDDDDNGNGIPDSEDIAGTVRTWHFGFGYAGSCVSFILIFMSLVLLICDRESEEIFYKEKEVEDEEEEEEE